MPLVVSFLLLAALVEVGDFNASIIEGCRNRTQVIEGDFEVVRTPEFDLGGQSIWVDGMAITLKAEVDLASAQVGAEALKVIGVVQVNEPVLPTDDRKAVELEVSLQ